MPHGHVLHNVSPSHGLSPNRCEASSVFCCAIWVRKPKTFAHVQQKNCGCGSQAVATLRSTHRHESSKKRHSTTKSNDLHVRWLTLIRIDHNSLLETMAEEGTSEPPSSHPGKKKRGNCVFAGDMDHSERTTCLSST